MDFLPGLSHAIGTEKPGAKVRPQAAGMSVNWSAKVRCKSPWEPKSSGSAYLRTVPVTPPEARSGSVSGSEKPKTPSDLEGAALNSMDNMNLRCSRGGTRSEGRGPDFGECQRP